SVRIQAIGPDGQALDATEPLVARKGRASYLGERSAGHLDPGAASTAILFDTLAAAISGSS
ncbi:DAK2 domain-containing protein, partial [Microbacterium sp. K24]|uniref:DAK2 domain-containing protein n=1 Tax=Microbacterium sp. K24 TaxID=2305446 RepID=UPI00109D3BD3